MKKFLKKPQIQKGTRPVLTLLGIAIIYNVLAPFPTLSISTSDKWLAEHTEAEAGIDLASTDAAPTDTQADESATDPAVEKPGLPVIEEVPKPKAIHTYRSTLTVYHSVPWETDGDPWTTASGSRARDGVVAANCLPFGTKLRIPELYGDKVFTVEDRLAPRKGCYIVDIWMEYSPDNKSFGAPVATIEILEGSPAHALARL